MKGTPDGLQPHKGIVQLTGPKLRSELCTAADVCISLQVASCSCSQPRQPLQQCPQLRAALRRCPAGLAPRAASQQALHLHQLAQHMQLYRLPHLLPPLTWTGLHASAELQPEGSGMACQQAAASLSSFQVLHLLPEQHLTKVCLR